MILKEIIEITDCIDRPGKVASLVAKLFPKQADTIQIKTISESSGSTEFIKIVIPGRSHNNPKLGIIGRLGGVGARPHRAGLVSDADGALTALCAALKIARMNALGDTLAGDVIVATHLCTNAPVIPHDPVAFMGSPVSLKTMNAHEVDPTMEAILSIDTSRGNRIINHTGFAVTPTVKEGWILKVSDDLLRIMEQTIGRLPMVAALTMQDITPYGNNISHLNSILQPSTATRSPVVGIAITSEVAVPGCATGVTNFAQIDAAGRFVIEVAQEFTSGAVQFYDPKEFSRLVSLYGPMKKLQAVPKRKI